MYVTDNPNEESSVSQRFGYHWYTLDVKICESIETNISNSFQTHVRVFVAFGVDSENCKILLVARLHHVKNDAETAISRLGSLSFAICRYLFVCFIENFLSLAHLGDTASDLSYRCFFTIRVTDFASHVTNDESAFQPPQVLERRI